MKTGIRYKIGIRCHKCNQRSLYEQDGDVYCESCDTSHYLTVILSAIVALFLGGILYFFVVK